MNRKSAMSASVDPKEEIEMSDEMKITLENVLRVSNKSLLPISRIPGILQSSHDTTSEVFENSKFNWLPHDDHYMEFTQLFRLINEVAPFYHPKRYYNLDCMALHKESDKSQLWSNFKQLLMMQCWKGIKFYGDICNKILSKDNNDHNFHSFNLAWMRSDLMEKKDMLFKGILEVEICESSSEFLFEPWVLIHLPFKPMLLHQWLLAAFAETLQFEKNLSEFFHSSIPSSLQKAAQQLAAVLHKLHEGFTKAFDHLHECTTSHPDLDKRPIIGVLEKMLPSLQFACSAEGKDMVKAMRRKIASAFSTGESLVNVQKEGLYHRKFLYSFEFWLGNHQRHGQLLQITCNGKPKIDPAWIQCSSDVVSEQEFLDYIKDLAPQTPLTEDLKRKLLAAFSLDIHLRLILLKYKFYTKMFVDKDGLIKCDPDVITNILTLQAEVEAADALNELVKLLKPIINLHPVNDLSGPDFDLKQVHEALTLAEGPQSGKSLFATVHEELSTNVNAEILIGGRPKLSITLDLDKIVLSLQARIKYVVLKMARRCYTESMLQPSNFFSMSDSDLAHYLLPCLVVALQELMQDTSATEENKVWCLHFVERMVNTFEIREMEINTNNTYMNHLHYLGDCKEGEYLVFTKGCKTALAAIPAELVSEGGALQQFRVCLEFHTTLQSFTCLHQMETFQFYNRLQYVLDSLSADKLLLVDNLMDICRVIAGHAYESVGYADNLTKTPDLVALAADIFAICCKFKDVSFHRLKKLKPGAIVDLVSEFKKEAANLSQQQLLTILMHMFVNYNRRDKQIETNYQKPTPFDQVYAVFHSYLIGDKWRLSQHLGHRMERVQHQVALQQAPVCYSLAIHEVSRKGKLKMGSPGEITFSPLQHCRWCGKVDVADFVVCKMCQEDQSYKDANLFCSSECETEALRVQHAEEHARHLMVLCGIQM